MKAIVRNSYTQGDDMKEVIVRFWRKGMKIACPRCGVKVREPYECKEHGKFKVKVKMNF